GRLVWRCGELAGSVRSVSFSPDARLLAASTYKTVSIWDVVNGRVVESLDGPMGLVSSVAFSPDARLLALGSDDGSVRLWSVAERRERRQFERHNRVSSVAFTPDGN